MAQPGSCSRFLLVVLAALVATGARPGVARAFTFGDIVLTNGANVREFRTDGFPVASIAVPYPPGDRGPFDPLLGVAFDAAARLGVFNGATTPFLSVYDPGAAGWSHASLAGWSAPAQGGLGGLAAFGTDFVAADLATASGPENGLVVFDGGAAFAARRESPGFDFGDVAVAPDGTVHALVAGTNLVFLFAATTMAAQGSIQLQGSVQAIAVAPDGDYYGVSGDGYIRRFTPEGTSVDTLDTAIPGLIDVAVNDAGEVVMGTALGEVVFTDAQLSAAKTFLVGGGPAYVAWVPYHASTPASRQSWGRIKDLYRR